jgi:hypothetical protein
MNYIKLVGTYLTQSLDLIISHILNVNWLTHRNLLTYQR